MSLPSRSKVFAVISLVIAVVLISINVVSCVSESLFLSKDKALNYKSFQTRTIEASRSNQLTLDDPKQIN